MYEYLFRALFRSIQHESSSSTSHTIRRAASKTTRGKRAVNSTKRPGSAVRSDRSDPLHARNSNHASKEQKRDNAAEALKQSSVDNSNGLVASVNVPDDPNGVLKPNHPAANILSHSSIVVQRQLEMMNVLIGFEQANRYVLMDPVGSHIGFLAEKESGVGNTMGRQAFGTHRSFTTHIFDRSEKEVLRLERPFSYLTSKICVYDAVGAENTASSITPASQRTNALSTPEKRSAQISTLGTSAMRLIGETHQQWAPLRRKYNLFLNQLERQEALNANAFQASSTSHDESLSQFAKVDEAFLSWDFALVSSDNKLLGSVNRNFSGFAREIFTDTGVYALRMDAAKYEERSQQSSTVPTQSQAQPVELVRPVGNGMTLDQRAVMLATAITIDFDYFSRHSGVGGGGFMPIWFPMGGTAGEAGAEAGAAEGAASEAGKVGAQQAARQVGPGESAAAGAGSLAGYDALQRSRDGGSDPGFEEQAPLDDEKRTDDDDWWNGGSEANGDAGGDSGDDGGGLDLDDFF